ncbi:MAG: hypothetical protein ACTHJ4_05400, partial [Candidatus Nucleicultricaceae bacterium]
LAREEEQRKEAARLEKERKEQERLAREEEAERKRIGEAMNHLFDMTYPNLRGMDISYEDQREIKQKWSAINELRSSRQSVEQDQFMEIEALHPQHFFDVASKAINHFKRNPHVIKLRVGGFTFGLEDNKLVVIGNQGQKMQASAFYASLENSHEDIGLELIQDYNNQIAELKANSKHAKVLKIMKSDTAEGKLLQDAVMQDQQSIKAFVATKKATHK